MKGLQLNRLDTSIWNPQGMYYICTTLSDLLINEEEFWCQSSHSIIRVYMKNSNVQYLQKFWANYDQYLKHI